jgi:hypothetical protein
MAHDTSTAANSLPIETDARPGWCATDADRPFRGSHAHA